MGGVGIAKYGQKKRRLPSFPRLPDAGRAARVMRFRSVPAFPEGPEWYTRAARDPKATAWGLPPPGFVIGTTSAVEWAALWAMWTIGKTIWGYDIPLLEAAERGIPPYWSYQVPLQGGRSIRGGSVIDFTVNINGRFLLVRIVTYYYHIAAGSGKLARDFNQLLSLSNPLPPRSQIVVDVLDSDIITDRTGQGAIKAMWKAVMGESTTNPALTGTARRIVPV